MVFVLLLRASCGPTRCCCQHSWGFTNVTLSHPLSLYRHFTLRISTEVYGYSLYVLLTLGGIHLIQYAYTHKFTCMYQY